MRSHYDDNKSYLVSGASFNEIRDGIQPPRHSGDNFKHTPDGEVYVVGTTATAYTPVGIGSLASADEDGNVLYGGFVFNATTPAEGEPWGVLEEAGVDGFATKCCVRGICRAVVNIDDATHTHATIDGSTLASADGGEARILWKANSGTGSVNCLIDITGGAFAVGESMVNAVEAVGSTLESHEIVEEYDKAMTLAVGQYEWNSGSTETQRPTVNQCEAEIKTDMGYAVPYIGIDSSTNASVVALESSQPPTACIGGLAYIDGKSKAVPVQKFSLVSSGTGKAIPYFTVSANSVSLSYMRISGTGIVISTDGELSVLPKLDRSFLTVDVEGVMAWTQAPDNGYACIPYYNGTWGFANANSTHPYAVVVRGNAADLVDMYNADGYTTLLTCTGNTITSWTSAAYTKCAAVMYYTPSGTMRTSNVGDSTGRVDSLFKVTKDGVVESLGAYYGDSLMCLCSQGGTFTYRSYPQ